LARPPLSKPNQDGAWASAARPRAVSDRKGSHHIKSVYTFKNEREKS